MDFLKLKNNFTFDFFVKGIVYDCYWNIYNVSNDQDFFNDKKIEAELHKNIVVDNIPTYLEARPKDSYDLFRIQHQDGFLADLRKYPSLQKYMEVQFGAKSRSKMRGYLRRLETCFDIRYKMYYGEITEKEFGFLFRKLKEMIGRRFSQRGDMHQSLKHWEYLKNNTLDMILKKSASLFVIFDNNKPIDICLNYHHQNVFRNYIRSYDIDYSKFRLGYIDIWKQLDWCFENNHTIFDLSLGDLAYKRTWCNTVYKFEHHVIYKKQNIGEKIKALTVLRLLQLRWFLGRTNLLKPYYGIKSLLKGSAKEEKKTDQETIFDLKDISNIELDRTSLSEVDIDDDEYAFIRKHAYNFQYLNFENSKNINVYRMNDIDGNYVISGLKKTQKLVFGELHHVNNIS